MLEDAREREAHRQRQRRMTPRRLPLLLATLLVACAAPATDEPSSPRSTPAETPEPSPTRSPRQPSPSPSQRGSDTIVGRLGGEDIEGGCSFVQTDDGTRYEVIWPEGWRIDARGNLVDPTDQVAARPGDELTVHGQIAGDMASICQIGPIFRASAVTTVQ
jgi:hypothetical protein